MSPLLTLALHLDNIKTATTTVITDFLITISSKGRNSDYTASVLAPANFFYSLFLFICLYTCLLLIRPLL